MEVLIRRNPEAVADEAFKLVAAERKRKPGLLLGLATGKSPLALYAKLRKLDWSKAAVFDLDEYVGLGPRHRKSFHNYLHKHFLGRVKVGQVWLFRGDAPDLEAECASIEAALRSLGGMDVQILGIGRDGHIGYNEPTSSFGSRTRIKTLSKETLADAGDVPFHVITMGIGTILEAKRIVMLATGESKADAVRAAVEGPVTSMCPASALQLHPNAVVIADEAAAGKLANAKYYRFVDQNKWKVARR